MDLANETFGILPSSEEDISDEGDNN